MPVHFVEPFLTARCGDVRNDSPRAQPKSLAADQLRFVRQTLSAERLDDEQGGGDG